MPNAIESLEDVGNEVADCTICAGRFAATATGHRPKPVVWFRTGARLLIAGQAPGLRVHESGVPFEDRSGDRLRDWMGIDRATFYDRSRISIIPMAFCFPGYGRNSDDLPPPAICAKTWHPRLRAAFDEAQLLLLVGGYAQRFHLGRAAGHGVTRTVASWREAGPNILPLPHPSWRNTGWIKRNPWFEADLLPVLRTRVRQALEPR